MAALLTSERQDALSTATRLRNQLHQQLHQLDPTTTYQTVAEVVGLGLGPIFIGAFNDHFTHSLGVGVIRYSMATAAVTTFIGGLLFVVAAQYMERDMARTVAD